MKPIRHPSNTRTLQAPRAWDHSGLPVEPLGVTDQVLEGVPCLWSFWQPDAEELAALQAGGHVVLSIVGLAMPPVAIMVTKPEGLQQAAPTPTQAALTDAQLIAAGRKLANYELTDEDVAFYLPRWRAFATEIGARGPDALPELESLESGEGDAR